VKWITYFKNLLLFHAPVVKITNITSSKIRFDSPTLADYLKKPNYPRIRRKTEGRSRRCKSFNRHETPMANPDREYRRKTDRYRGGARPNPDSRRASLRAVIDPSRVEPSSVSEVDGEDRYNVEQNRDIEHAHV
jgi:hypothetical protein